MRIGGIYMKAWMLKRVQHDNFRVIVKMSFICGWCQKLRKIWVIIGG
jgi:hypothetical protein